MNAPSAWRERCRLLVPAIAEACAAVPADAGIAALTHAIRQQLPDWRFRAVRCRGGWYRLGGVVDAAGGRISEALSEWASAALDARGGDLALLAEDFADSGLRTTQLNGRSHYLVAPVPGGGHADFLQLEIEVLQEAWAAPLFDGRVLPATLDELIDARGSACDDCSHPPERRCGTPMNRPRHHVRRLTHMGDLLAQMRTQTLDPQPIHRFLADWERSSAGRAAAFCHHWVLSLREHVDIYRQTVTRAVPLAAVDGEAPDFPARDGMQGLSLAQALSAYDREAGYPMAWFFALVTGRRVPHGIAGAVAADARDGFAYLPEADLTVVRQWLHQPYGFR